MRVTLSFSEQRDTPIKVDFDVTAPKAEPQPVSSDQPPDSEGDIETSAKAVLSDIMDRLYGSLNCESFRKCHRPLRQVTDPI